MGWIGGNQFIENEFDELLLMVIFVGEDGAMDYEQCTLLAVNREHNISISKTPSTFSFSFYLVHNLEKVDFLILRLHISQ